MVILKWIAGIAAAFLMGKLVKKIKLPEILGWLIAGMILGPNAAGVLPQTLLDSSWYKVIISWMQCSFGIMLGTELIWRKLKSYGKALVLTTLTQSLGTFAVVTLVFGIIFHFSGIPVYLAAAFGGIALATAPAPALSIVQEFQTKGPVTDTLLPMAVLDDVVGIVVFFTVDSIITRAVSGGTVPLYMIPVMIFLPILIGVAIGFLLSAPLKKDGKKAETLVTILIGVTLCTAIGYFFNTAVLKNITINYMLIGVSFSTVFSNLVSEERLNQIAEWYHPILQLSLIVAIVDLGAPLDYHLIAGAGLYTFVYIAARAAGKYFGARFGAKATHLPETVQKYLGLTLLPHSGVSLVFTGIICAVLEPVRPDLASIVKGTIAAAAVINEIIAVLAARKGFELAGEIPEEPENLETKYAH
ncbi:MAG: cation:proton antiporter [Stecheria intestinalis]|jgi:Kef-type K+ transport system membrane component KefB|uniref:cation:proton antiporter n=1 Tax=Stecheria intestinalis TaxID=2606630 RepID=UPI0023F3575E|nr:cation:proton antiporter [Stecheria intestinalis]MDD5882086.1 cation:proton antiporter [Stecheria intestinalis]MDD6367408.1 cation:proton antiporter [Stecheria intestinalis]MDD7681073.1 cation:proton antiporter [Stecheria intestinalis]MDY4682417.1 cation:proton antiporter [Lachnospiraceae bacterium]